MNERQIAGLERKLANIEADIEFAESALKMLAKDSPEAAKMRDFLTATYDEQARVERLIDALYEESLV